MDDEEIERIFWQFIDVAKTVIKKMIQIAIMINSYVQEGLKEIYKGEKMN